MPSPFPGMDPYLEQPEFFPGLHDRLVTHLSEFLQTRLPEPYYAEVGSRVWIEFSERLVNADVNVLRPRQDPAPGPVNGGVAVAVGSAQPVVVHVPHDARREPFVEVYTRQGGRRLVTAIEVLSLSNKMAGEHGRDLYLQKQRELLRSRTHLLEIDFLRGGTHSTAVPRDRAVAEAGAFDYHVCLHRFTDLQCFLIYPIRLEQRLPTVSVPLLPGDADVPLDLQAVFDICYDAGPYRRLPLYRESTPAPPLRPQQAAWANQLLRDKGVLPPA